MKILIELPTWLGDTVMTTPAIENLINYYGNVELTMIGSKVSIEALKNHPNVVKVFIIDKNFNNFYKIIKSFGKFDLFFSFRSSLRSKLYKLFIPANMKYKFKKQKYGNLHQVEKYNSFINEAININSIPGKLILHTESDYQFQKSKLLGINPGASYGDSKRWTPEEFADVATKLSNKYDIIIFGGPNEQNIATDIEKYLINNKVENYKNLAGKTSIPDLINNIANLDLLVTGDSGPMHVASAFHIPTVTIFGPTNDKETSQWMNKKSKVVKMDLDCQPCMKRSCPLLHHNCMKLIKAKDVLIAIKQL